MSKANSVDKSEEAKHHGPNGTFVNPWPSAGRQPGFSDFYQVMKDLKPVDLPPKVKAFPIVPPNWETLANPPNDKIQLTWIGHASFLLQMEGLNILTDPIFSERCSAVQFVGPKRFTPLPFKFEELTKLPKIDFVIISHNHYDHLDTNTVKALLPKVNMWYVPLGIRDWLIKSGAKPAHCVELDWWQKRTYGVDRMEVVCTPCQHFSGRFLHDRNRTLWASWTLVGKQSRFFFGGDTGYRAVPRDKTEDEIKQMPLPTCPAFKEIGEKYGPFDLACIPIGAYSPRWFMSSIHCNPEDAVNLHIDIKCKQSVAMHWGTFKLTDEPVWEPPEIVKKEMIAHGLNPDHFVTMLHGEIKLFAPGTDKHLIKPEETKEVAADDQQSKRTTLPEVVEQVVAQQHEQHKHDGDHTHAHENDHDHPHDKSAPAPSSATTTAASDDAPSSSPEALDAHANDEEVIDADGQPQQVC